MNEENKKEIKLNDFIKLRILIKDIEYSSYTYYFKIISINNDLYNIETKLIGTYDDVLLFNYIHNRNFNWKKNNNEEGNTIIIYNLDIKEIKLI